MLISHVIRFNATDAPFKQTAFPQYEFPHAKKSYAEIADLLGLGGKNDDEKVRLCLPACTRICLHPCLHTHVP